MAFENVGSTLPGGFLAGADLSSSQFYAVVVNSSGAVVAAGAGVQVDGILQNKPASGEVAAVWGPGSVSKCSAGAAITLGDAVASAADGQVVTATTGDFIIGRALQAAANADEIISVWVTMPGVAP